VADSTADGGFHWQEVGRGTTGLTNVLDTSTSSGFGPCAASTSAEDACSLNANPTRDAEDPRVAAGSLTLGGPTVPWVTWAEDTGSGRHGIFVGRLVGGSHFERVNGGAPISDTRFDATHPDITFFANIPYVSWIEKHGPNIRGFVGHFDTTGVFVKDTPFGIPLIGAVRHPGALIDFRAPLSSSCTLDPFTSDGSTCVVAPVNDPFFLFTTAGSPQRLEAEEILGGPNCVLFKACSVSVTPQGNGAVIQSQLAQSNTVGILVQRVVGFKHVHGHRVPRVRTVGRVPLGHHRHGHLRLHWNLKVNGKRLHRGTYLITLRALKRHRTVIGVTRSVLFKVRR
jgi:hypothetical protein